VIARHQRIRKAENTETPREPEIGTPCQTVPFKVLNTPTKVTVLQTVKGLFRLTFVAIYANLSRFIAVV
jgi:hypothetical protein